MSERWTDAELACRLTQIAEDLEQDVHLDWHVLYILDAARRLAAPDRAPTPEEPK